MSMLDLVPFSVKSHDPFDSLDRRATLGDFRSDIIEESDRYVLECELPGFSREAISVDASDDRLTITAKRTEPDRTRTYVHRERSFTTWQRSFSLSNIETDSITASYTDGVLRLNLPKVQPKSAQARKIEIQ